jgi:hypothetical protein
MGVPDAAVIDVDSVVDEGILTPIERVAVSPGQLGECAFVSRCRLSDQAG